MRNICLICWLALLGACAAQHAVRISCDGKLRPINTPAPPASVPLATAVPGTARNGAP